MVYKDKITELGENLKSLNGYFISRWDIINCRYVTKMTHKPTRYKSSYRSQYHLTLTDGYEFPVPTKRASEVKKIMKQISR